MRDFDDGLVPYLFSFSFFFPFQPREEHQQHVWPIAFDLSPAYHA